MKMTNLLSCTTKAWAIDLSVQKGGFTVDDWRCECFFFFLPGVDKQQRRNIRWTGYFPAGRIPGGISVPKGRSELLSLWRFFCWKKRRVFIHEKEMTITYFAKNMLPRLKVSCRKLCPRSFQRRLGRRLKEELRSLRVLYTSPVYYPIIILLSFNFQSNMLSSLCGFSFCNRTIVVVLYVCRTSV